jgi:quercetin dioxygenase-like cupin family protein
MERPILKAAAAVAVGLTAGVLGLGTLHAQATNFKRVELQKQELSIAGHEAVVARGEFAADGVVPKHTHPGEELAFVLEGSVVVEIAGKPPATLKAGEVFFVPAGVAHAVKNVGAQAKVVSTYVVSKGKPLVSFVK